MPRREPSAPRGLDRYVVAGEPVVLAVRLHWAKIVEPVASAVVGFVVVAWLDTLATAAVGAAGSWVWWLWVAVLVRSLWLVVDWTNEWFVVTQRRLLLLHGLVTRRVSMMPLTKVTDMDYSRSPAGRVLGYGEFTLESAGQEQALHRIRWVAHPDATYRTIVGTIFPPDGPGDDGRRHVPGGGVATAPPRSPVRAVPPAAPAPPGGFDDVTQPIDVTQPVASDDAPDGPPDAPDAFPHGPAGDWSRAVRIEPFHTRDRP